MRCHCCDLALTIDAPLPDTCETCLYECLCWNCREGRWERAQDRSDDLAYDVSREA